MRAIYFRISKPNIEYQTLFDFVLNVNFGWIKCTSSYLRAKEIFNVSKGGTGNEAY